MLSHAPTPGTAPPPIKRSHSHDALASPESKRHRATPDTYLGKLERHELIELIHRIEAVVSESPVADDVHRVVYGGEEAGTHERASVAPADAPPSPEPEVIHVHSPEQPAPQAQPAAQPAAPPAVPPAAPQSLSPTPPAEPRPPLSQVYTPSIPPRDAPGNISTRIAAILDSLNSSNGSSPMLGLQGQPLAPARQAGSSSLSSLLSSSSILNRPREATAPTAGHGAAASVPLRTEGGLDLSRLGGPTFDTPFTTTPGVQHSAVATHPATGAAYMPAEPHAHDSGMAREHRITSTLPSYEDMIVEGLQAIGDVNGTPPRMLFHWMEDTYPLMKNFRPSASQALQKAFKRGRLHKVGSLYRINPDWDGSNTGRKPTRRPQIGKDHPMMVNGPKGPAPASPFKARAQFQGAAAYRQAESPLTRPPAAQPRILQGLRPGPKPYGQPGAAPLDNPASGIFQNGAAAAALLLAHQQRRAGGGDTVSELTPTLLSLAQQLRSSSSDDGSTPPLTSVLANALLKHAQAGERTGGAEYSSPVMQSLSRLLGARQSTPGVFAPSGPGSLSASIETLMQQATQQAQAQVQAPAPAQDPPPAPQGGDIDDAVSKTLEAAFQQIDTPAEESGGSADGGINLSDYGDALRTLTAAFGGTEDEQRLADERAIAEAEADADDDDEGDDEGGGTDDGSSQMTSLLQSYGIEVSTDELQQLTAGLQNVAGGGDAQAADGQAQADVPPEPEQGDERPAEGDGDAASVPMPMPDAGAGASADAPAATDDATNQAIQSQLEALISSLSAGTEPES